jgi:hypothetical protein
MKLVLRSVLAQSDVTVQGDLVEVSRRRSITLSPSRRATTVLRERARTSVGEGAQPIAGVAA